MFFLLDSPGVLAVTAAAAAAAAAEEDDEYDDVKVVEEVRVAAAAASSDTDDGFAIRSRSFWKLSIGSDGAGACKRCGARFLELTLSDQ